MLKNEDLRDVTVEGVLTPKVAIHYLNLYVGQADWSRHIGTVWQRIQRNVPEPQRADTMRRAVACAVLLPSKDRSTYIDPENPQNLLLKISSFHQFNERDWWKLFQETVERDFIIEGWRTRALGLGIIDPIEYAPNARQAFNWLYMKAEESGAVTTKNKAELVERFKNLVLAYGGAVICNIFTRHEEQLKKIVNWRTGYFFERVIWDVYTLEQVLKIKKAELDQTSERLVKRIKVGA